MNLYRVDPSAPRNLAIELDRSLPQDFDSRHHGVLPNLKALLDLGPALRACQSLAPRIQVLQFRRVIDSQADALVGCNAIGSHERFRAPTSLCKNSLLPNAVILQIVLAIENQFERPSAV